MICRFIILFIVIGISSCEERRTPESHIIPAGYNGVVITIYDQAGYPELPLKDGFLVLKYPKDGILITSSKQEFGWASDEILESSENGIPIPITLGTPGDRRKRSAGTGSWSNGDIELEYAYKGIGTESNDLGSSGVDRKIEEALQKLQQGMKTRE